MWNFINEYLVQYSFSWVAPRLWHVFPNTVLFLCAMMRWMKQFKKMFQSIFTCYLRSFGKRNGLLAIDYFLFHSTVNYPSYFHQASKCSQRNWKIKVFFLSIFSFRIEIASPFSHERYIIGDSSCRLQMHTNVNKSEWEIYNTKKNSVNAEIWKENKTKTDKIN